ncbi:hypothetical protein B0H13DRAFT_1090616 [Mycena leptocephala]|nr:hypothetical protein B0H13DRAFT_1090616 [Mycena leptocephala]
MLLHVARVQRVRTSGSVIATLASTNFKHPIVQFRAIIVRIALYPLLSCFLSITACILSIYISIPAHKLPLLSIRIYGYLMQRPIPSAPFCMPARRHRSLRSLRQETESKTSSQGVPSPTSHSHTTTTVSFQWASKQLGKGLQQQRNAHG